MEVRLKDLTMCFNEVVAVDQLSISIETGKLVTLLGPSGCGKSTTLFLIAGLYKPTGGQIYFNEQDVTYEEPESRDIGMVFQNYALYPHLTVLNNILFPLKMHKVPKREALIRAQEVAEMVGIPDLLKRKPSQLSGGQQQRVAIARALVKRPVILLLDEPLSNLDARLRIETREEIRRIQREVGITTVFVTHDQEEAMSISDKIVLMKDGHCLQYSTPQELYDFPNNLFASEFLGSPPINVFQGIINGEKISLQPSGVDARISLPKHLKKAITNDSEIYFGVRPESFTLCSGNGDYHLRGKVLLVERVGRETLLKVESGRETIRCILPPGTAVNVNNIIHLKIDLDRVLIFNYKSGERIK